ncbi:MAG: 50S ribosome-binding GTPase [Planctomycetota bacterium]|nr:50S ribosome-binding GTPase [Planctomycetota bacterium]
MHGIADTIAAISGDAAGVRCVVRVSGSAACEVASRMGMGGDIARAGAPPGRGVRPTTLHLPGRGSLRTLAVWLPASNSATGEDTVEFLVPGGVASAVLEALCGCGARPAEAGEFSMRAFLNGRLSLEEAEGVAATISAVDDDGLRAARRLREGRLGRLCDGWQRDILSMLALVEAGIDFTDEEDVVPIAAGDLRERCDALGLQLEAAAEGCHTKEVVTGAPRVVLCGTPNAGKSTLFNALLGRRRAVEADVAGTTRDALVERWRVRGAAGSLIECELVDLPGVPGDGDPFRNPVRAVIEREIKGATVILACARGGSAAAADGTRPGRVISVVTCADLGIIDGEDGVEQPAVAAIRVSAKTGEGLDTLCVTVAASLARWQGSHAAVVSRARHLRAIQVAIQSVEDAQRALSTDIRAIHQPELVAEGLRRALDALGSVSGRLTGDDVLGEVFSRFCVGK